MTSSKSLRAAILPASLSLSSLRSHSYSEPKSKASPDSPPRKKPRTKLTRNSHRNQRQHPSAREVEVLRHSPESTAKKGHDLEPVVSPHPLGQRARTWSDRFSSFLPSLTPQSADVHQSSPQPQSIPSRMPSTEPPPPPPFELDVSSGNYSDMGQRRMGETEPQQPNPTIAFPQYSPPQPPQPPSSSAENPTDTPKLGASTSRHHPDLQMMAPSPPSPETERTIFQLPELATEKGPPTITGDSHTQEQLQRANVDDRPRNASFTQRKASPPKLGLKTRQTAPVSEVRGRSVSAQIPSTVLGDIGSPRIVSSPVILRPNSGNSQSPSRRKLRRTWMPGGRSRSNSVEVSNGGNMPAWVMSENNQVEYNTSFLKNGERVPELWNENGAVVVYLYPRSSGCGPSFKVPEYTISSSHIFNELIRSEVCASTGPTSRTMSFGGRDSLRVDDATRIISPLGPSSDYSADLRLYLPAAPSAGTSQLAAPGEISVAELDRLIAIRNLFAFLTGQPLVGTKSCPTIFQAFLQIAGLLQEFCFASPGGHTFGDAVDLSFGFYSESLGLADCRQSREQTLEALILGERMRSTELYNEAFAHAAGKYSAIKELRLPLFEQVSLHTRQRLERAHLDLVNRQHSVNVHLEQFDFPSVFSGIANSTSVPELRLVRFKAWRNSFSKMRQFVLGYYKSAFGSWPPKASSKKNPFAESGLNRLVLKVLYSDMCALYDLLVDRKKLTSRVIDEAPAISDAADKMTTSALRNILSEFDRSKPPVLPPIPFDLPQLPTMTAVFETYNGLSIREQAKFDKKIKEHELILVLNKAYNYDANSIALPFLDQFKEFELREARGKTAHDLLDQRIGYWLFLYIVLQSLPMLVVDAPELKFSEGVEYFLCEPPMGNPPWVDDTHVRKMWYEVAGGGGYVELSADAVMFSVEATYHRSHCWLAAKLWEETNGAGTPPQEHPAYSPLQPPPLFHGSEGAIASPAPLSGQSTPSPPPGSPQMALRPRNFSPARSRVSSAYRSSIVMGLEPVPMEPSSLFGTHQRSSSLGPRLPSSRQSNRSASSGNLAGMNPTDSGSSSPAPAATSGATFDDILGGSQKKPTGKKKSRFF